MTLNELIDELTEFRDKNSGGDFEVGDLPCATTMDFGAYAEGYGEVKALKAKLTHASWNEYLESYREEGADLGLPIVVVDL